MKRVAEAALAGLVGATAIVLLSTYVSWRERARARAMINQVWNDGPPLKQ